MLVIYHEMYEKVNSKKNVINVTKINEYGIDELITNVQRLLFELFHINFQLLE